jgi:HD-GYP domain-containing protein (c-di-GMP phosphodiesterase class II)
MHNCGHYMHLIPVSIDSIRIGQPLPFPLMDRDGVLLARKAFVVASRDTLIEFSQRGGGLYVDVADSEAHHRAYVDKLYGLVRDEKPLGEIAEAKIAVTDLQVRDPALEGRDEKADWFDLQEQCNFMLRDTQSESFKDRLERLDAQLGRHLRRNPDGTLFALIYLSATEKRLYSATHAMLVGVMCSLAARDVLGWPPAIVNVLFKAALTMNVGMTDLQDKLAVQLEAPSNAQKDAIALHAVRSGQILAAMGIDNALWLEAVREHHHLWPGPLLARTPAQQLARLIQRADMFAARLAPRASRPPTAPASAMQACYFDENKAVDEAGAALIKAVGIYQPGSFVKLATDEVAIVIRRGANTSTPRVAVLVNRSGIPTVEPTLRDSALRDYRVVASVPHREVKVQVNLERLLPLTQLPSSERPW